MTERGPASQLGLLSTTTPTPGISSVSFYSSVKWAQHGYPTIPEKLDYMCNEKVPCKVNKYKQLCENLKRQ